MTTNAPQNGGILTDLPPASSIKCTPPSGDRLNDSILELRESLANGTIMSAFERLYRRKPGLTMTVARHQDNISKNRYRDISPCKISC